MKINTKSDRWMAGLILMAFLQACGQAAEAPSPEQLRDDTREVIRLDARERAQVLGEMRAMLDSVEGVVSGLAAADMEAIANAAARSGRPQMGANDQALHGKLPEAYRYMGSTARGGFDEIAQMARDGEGREAITARLSGVLQACTSCHAAYQIHTEQ